ncbi:MAG TPA: hypothetical protein VK421_07460 [Pyrinomonadaceae bacterium]|nr:hypothetical protein [Pyrinomonadaceae bacterium]
MPDIATVVNIGAALTKRAQPAVTRWNRLEGRPRTHHFERALRAEVRDALWMLTRQWQMGEFLGDDAGSPVLTRICSEMTIIDRYQAASGPVETFPKDEPLEAKVERRPIPWSAGTQKLSYDLRVALGRRWQKMLKAALDRGELSADYRAAYRAAYPIALPDPDDPADAAVCAHPEDWQQISALAGRAMDGFALLEHAARSGNNAFDNVGAAAADEGPLTTLAAALRAWLDEMFWQPEEAAGAWLPRKLEYQFACSAPLAGKDLVTRATEYYHGHLDWYALERTDEASLGDTPSGGPAPEIKVQTLLPVALVFAGMPNTRWWEFEDRRTNFGEVKPDTTDLGKLLLLEFGLVYANDWFIFPYTLPIGSITQVKGVAVTNVFNERVWVEPVRPPGNSPQSNWSLFQLTAPAQAEPSLVLLPTAGKVQEGRALEEVALVRDEMANMVWAIEKRVWLPSGAAKGGAEIAREYFRHLERIIGPPPEPPEAKAPIRYRLMNTVPENWIPFIPVHVAGSSRETQLQRAALPRLLGSDPTDFEKIRPRTTLLREGLEAEPDPVAYYIDEEEVPRAGALVRQSFQRTRWLGGKPFVWLGVTKTTGRGEGSSGLAFDYLSPDGGG